MRGLRGVVLDTGKRGAPPLPPLLVPHLRARQRPCYLVPLSRGYNPEVFLPFGLSNTQAILASACMTCTQQHTTPVLHVLAESIES